MTHDLLPACLSHLEALVGFETTSHLSNLALIGYVEDVLKPLGFCCERTYDQSGQKATLFATFIPAGSLALSGGLCFSAHADTVPTTGQVWAYPPYQLSVSETRAYGRGTTDMKGFLSCILTVLPHIVRSSPPLPLHVMVSYDEEVGCLGVHETIQRFGKDLPCPRFVIVGEPSRGHVAIAHKSITSFQTRVLGHAVHSSQPQLGHNAIYDSAEIIQALQNKSLELEDIRNPFFDPPFSTLHVGVIHGGTARNIVPERVDIFWEIRGLPDCDSLQIMADVMAPFHHSASMRVETDVVNVMPAFGGGMTSDAARRMGLDLFEQRDAISVPYGTEAGHFERAGIATVVCGPGSIDQAHTADEFIELADLSDYLDALHCVFARLHVLA